MLKKVKCKGGFFADETQLELFAKEDRLSLIYGKNGSGKSTIAKVISKAKGDLIEEITDATLYDHEDMVYTDVQSIHVFNEDYINSRVQQMEDKDYIEYFKNLMYRLVLNGESHMQERTNSLKDMDYFDFLSNQERRRTAREVLCFIYLLNEKHILAHLEGKKDVVSNLKKWCAEIKSFCTGEEVTA